jgi:hypothetical protein
MVRSLILAVFCLVAAGCSSERSIAVIEEFVATDQEGNSLPESITTVPSDGFSLIISYRPATLDATLFADRPLQPAEKWRLRCDLEDSRGNPVWPERTYFEELYSFGELGMEGVRNGEGDKKKLLWMSPEEPVKTVADGFSRWGRVRFPSEPGNYTLHLRVYPTADPRKDGKWGNPEFGEGFSIVKIPVKVIAAEPGKEPVLPNESYFRRCKPALRELERITFEDPSNNAAIRKLFRDKDVRKAIRG